MEKFCNAYLTANETLLLAKTLQFVSNKFGDFKYDYFSSMAIGINHHVTINGYEFVFNFDGTTIHKLDVWGKNLPTDNAIYNVQTIMDFVLWYSDNITKTNCFQFESLGTKLLHVTFEN